MKNWILALLIPLCAALAVATLRAAAQSVMTGPRTLPGLATVAPAGQAPASQVPAGQAPAAPAPVTTAPAAPAGPNQGATVAPDKRQSADNNVSFPVDI
jgi:pyruvate dehydrogenase E2 component (dihydrolipoamide acetyltransferase)